MRSAKKAFVMLVLVMTAAIVLTACAGVDVKHIHSYGDWVVKVKPTCTEDGIRQRDCACGDIQEDTIPATGHVIVDDAAFEPTCTTEGKTAGSHCSECGEVFVAQEIIPAKGHIYTEEVTKVATGTVKGTKKYKCSVCGDTYEEEYEATKLTSEELYALAEKTVVEITTYNKNGEGLSLGSGFIISADGQVVTNFHVIDEAYKIVVDYNNRNYEVQKIISYSSELDLAILKINLSDAPFVVMNEDLQPGGSAVYAVGSSEGYTLSFSAGTIASPERVFDGVHYIQHSSAISHGNSGGPLFNSYGEVIGINTSTDVDGQNLNFAIMVSELKRLPQNSEMTMAEYYEKEGPVFEVLPFDYIVNERENNNMLSIAQTITKNGTTISGVLTNEEDWDFYKITIGPHQTLYAIMIPSIALDAEGILCALVDSDLSVLDAGTKTDFGESRVNALFYENDSNYSVSVYYLMLFDEDYYFKSVAANYNVFFYVK
ncbi:MAG: trypsin-like peptidase domain-containing protein [Clostridia bacterium]|nr:trypsin-like peptidase domain-containing protein [Clostridia bacterium]